MEWLQTVCNVIIIVGGAIMAIKNVAEWFGKPIRFFKKKSTDNFEERVKEILNKVLPDLLVAHDLEIRDKYKADREAYLQDIKKEVLKEIKTELSQVSQLTEQYEALAISAKDVLREKIMAIYHKNKYNRSMTEYERESLNQYYVDYKALNGNSYIDKRYNRMDKWRVIYDDDPYDDEE